jgi:thiamine kinase-like enzyme
MEAATDPQAVAAFARETLAGTGWELDSVRHRVNRVDPPNSYWSVFAVDIYKDGEERSLRLVARGALNPEAWEQLSARLVRHGAGNPCDPINGLGYPRLFPETWHAYWFYPYDPSMPGLSLADDPARVAGILLGLDDLEDMQAAAQRVEIERVRYLPEVSAILRYTIDVGGTPMVIYGKVQPGRRGLRTNGIVEGLWRASANYPGYLKLPRPLGYIEEMGMLIEEGIRGKPLSSRRTSTEFMLLPEAAAEALAVIHEARVENDERITIQAELARLDKVAEKFKYVHPEGYFLLNDLLTHVRERVQKTPEEDWLPTHGDFKYDQFMIHNHEFTVLDFDYYATAETSYDLGKFCAYLVPSRPRDWTDSVAVEEARVRFIRRYRELRPHATLQRFQVYEALQFALRAMSAMWMQKPGWHRVAETYLVLGFERLKSRLPE